MLKFIVKILKDKHMDIATIILGKEIHCIELPYTTYCFLANLTILIIVSATT